MRELPILMCPKMVKSILEGRKTQTRRIIATSLGSGDRLPNFEVRLHNGIVECRCPPENQIWRPVYFGTDKKCKVIKPRYQVGDILWVKERCSYRDILGSTVFPKTRPAIRHTIIYGEGRSSRFMPKWAARLWLRVTAVKDPHQIQTISNKDILAEGIVGDIYGEEFGIAPTSDPRSASIYFFDLWNRLHPKPGERWEDNPYVFGYEFQLIKRMEGKA